MAVIQTNKFRVCDSCYPINRAFNIIVVHGRIVQEIGLFPIMKMRELIGLVEKGRSKSTSTLPTECIPFKMQQIKGLWTGRGGLTSPISYIAVISMLLKDLDKD